MVKFYVYKISGVVPTENKTYNVFVFNEQSESVEGFIQGLADRSFSDIFLISSFPISVDLEEITANEFLTLEKSINLHIFKDVEYSPVDSEILNVVLCFDIVSVKSINSAYEQSPYKRPINKDGKNILFVFPGVIYPRNLGSHQRAITMLLSLIKQGCNVDILYTGGNEKIRSEVADKLHLLSGKITPYSNLDSFLKKIPRGVHYFNRYFLRIVRRLFGSFRAQTFKKITWDMRQKLRLLTNAKKYDHIFINYAWLIPVISSVKSGYKGSFICDTHDVQFYRDNAKNGKNKKTEISLLRRMDKVIAISERDGGILKGVLKDEKVWTYTSPFNYMGRYNSLSPKPVLTFGFVGHNMEANYKALEIVAKEWWPAIKKHSPDSKFFVAGSICNNPKIKNLMYLRDGIELLGFVDSLNKFYNDIDVVLSPVVVKGGMNFKNVEAVVAGKVLITNEAGTEALQPLKVPYSVNNSQELIEFLTSFELRSTEVLQNVVTMHEEAVDIFTDVDTDSSGLVEIVK